ncbi:hypothetical protein WS67_05870 [Burkholderia singularis]|uniref:Uncharacterized protein n=1 Tax=Burkholderia singularis TaxID=1503053 RepID=A0A103E6U3_9BURK|nr:DUF3022 domain-containing protein [Burkholderia singularis]KVE29373.1 hypothetical protein WS67_05870 [Burkholderia singularis]
MTAPHGRPVCIAALGPARASASASHTSVAVYADETSGRLTIQVTWMRASASARGRDCRCTVDLAFQADALARYTTLDAAERRRVRMHLCNAACRAVDERQWHADDAAIKCRVALEVTAAELDAALRLR